MQIVILDRATLGFDIDVNIFSKFGNVTSYEVDEQSETFRKKNIEKFGKIDKNGNLVAGKKIQALGVKDQENIKKEIEESNRRYKKWQQEQQ